MVRSAALIAAAAALLASPALAQTASCARPDAPAPIDGATATLDQLVAAKAATAAFQTASDTYQQCVLDDVNAQKAAAKASKSKFDSAVAKAANAQIDANQVDKEKVAQAFNSAVKAYKAAHPA